MNNLAVQYRSLGRGANLRAIPKSSNRLQISAITFVLYAAGSLAGFALQLPAPSHSGQIAILWPANAVLVSVLLIVSVPDWPVAGLAALVAHLITQGSWGTPVWLMGMQFGHNCVLAILIVGTIKIILGDSRFAFDTLGQTILFLLVGVAIVPAIAAIGPACIRAVGGISEGFAIEWRTIALSNALSIGIMTPSLMALCWQVLDPPKERSVQPLRWLELTLLLGGITAISILVFSSFAEHHLTRIPALIYLPIPLLIWAAIRFGPTGASLSHLVVAVLCIRGGLAGVGPFAMNSIERSAATIQCFLMALYVPNLCLAVVTRERETAVFTLKRNELCARGQYAQLSNVYRHAPIGLAFLDTRQVFRAVNEFLAAIHGLCVAELVGRSIDDVLAPELAAHTKTMCRHVMSTGEAEIDREVSGRSSANPNSRRDWLVSHFPVKDGSAIVGVNVILQDITDRKRAAAEIQNNHLALHASLDRIQDLAGRLIQVQEAERARIARELHDDVNQQLAALSMAISGLKRRVPTNTAIRSELEAVQQRAINLTDEVRNLCHGLHSGVLQHAGLVPALRAYCHEQEGKHGVTTSLSVEQDIGVVSSSVSLCLYRVVQEAITNVLRHARATKTTVQLANHNGGLELTVRDDGCGFEVTGVAARRGLGLISIEERVRLVHGNLNIESRLRTGTTLRVWVPKE